MSNMVTETFVCEVNGVSRESKYLQGYGKPPTNYTAVSMEQSTQGQTEPIRSCRITLPADLPIGTRFKVTVEQVDEVTAATIHRGALPVIDDRKQIEGEVQ
jgi:hypothetical protein